jgi:hypothetical protein
MNWLVYLSGEIHTDWRLQIANGAEKHQLPVSFCLCLAFLCTILVYIKMPVLFSREYKTPHLE